VQAAIFAGPDAPVKPNIYISDRVFGEYSERSRTSSGVSPKRDGRRSRRNALVPLAHHYIIDLFIIQGNRTGRNENRGRPKETLGSPKVAERIPATVLDPLRPAGPIGPVEPRPPTGGTRLASPSRPSAATARAGPARPARSALHFGGPTTPVPPDPGRPNP
jgi:hypothetical protein